MTCLSKVFLSALALLLLISWLSPAFALEPRNTVSPPPMEPGYPNQGSVTGQITSGNSGQGVPGAYVAIVNAADWSQAFYEGQTDENGYYRFQAVNNTIAGDGPRLTYCVYARYYKLGEGLSNPFAVWENTTATVNVTIPGMVHGANPTPDTSRTSSGFVVEHVPMPDEIRLNASPDTIMAEGNSATITAQLYLNGEPYTRSGVVITFFTDNDTRGYLPADKKIVTDAYGWAAISLTSGNNSGQVNVTGYSHTGISRNITGTCTLYITSLPPESEVIDINGTEASNTTGNLTTGSTDNVTPSASSDVSGQAGITVMPEPATSAVSQVVYPALLIALVAVAGFTAYMLVFRKK